MHFAARALIYYAHLGGRTVLVGRQVIRVTPARIWLDLLGLPYHQGEYYKADPQATKRAFILAVHNATHEDCHRISGYAVQALFEHFDFRDQVKLLTILESYYGMGHDGHI